MKPAIFLACLLSLYYSAPALARTEITYQQLMNGVEGTAPVKNKSYMEDENSSTALHNFYGTLSLTQGSMNSNPRRISKDPVVGKNPQLFPRVNLEFFTHGNELVPVVRDIIRPEPQSSYWEIIVSPGRVWSEASDRGWSRASFPFALVNSLDGDSHNGIATFLFNSNRVSSVRFQIVQGGLTFLIPQDFVAWGALAASYQPKNGAVPPTLVQDYVQEKNNRANVLPWSQLEAQYGEDALAGFDGTAQKKFMLISGLIIGNRVYAKDCATPYGDFPYCSYMHLGVQSMEKSLFGALAMFWAAEKYGKNNVLNALIRDYVTVTASHNGWNLVRFVDAWNMATGIGHGSTTTTPNDIEDGYDFNELDMEWIQSGSKADKLDKLFQEGMYPWGPGQYARYRDQDSFILSVALDAFVKRRDGNNASLWTSLVQQVFRPIGIHHPVVAKTVESSGPGVPLAAYGMFATVDDLAKITTLMQKGGRHENTQYLHRGLINESLYSQEEKGFGTAWMTPAGEYKYMHSFWRQPYRNNNCFYQIPVMQGWGGNVIALFPNDMVGFRMAKNPHYSNDAVWDITGMANVANAIQPFCASKK